MKKILIMFVCMALLACAFTVLPVSASAAQIVVESKMVSAGAQVELTVSIHNNPGMMYLELSPQVDTSLTLVNVKNGELFSSMTQGKQYVWSESENVTDDGLLMTFIFEAPQESGNYKIDFIFRSAYDYNENDVTIAVVSGSVTVEAAGNTADDIVSVLGATIKTETEIANQGMRYEIKVGDEAAIADVKELGILLIPASYLGSTELTVATSAAVKLSTVRGDSNWDAVIADGGFQASLLESTIQGRQNWQIVSRAYAVLNSGEVLYGEASVKSVTSVALAIANTAKNNGAATTDEIEALLAKETLGDVEIADILTFCRDNIDKL